MVAELSNSNPLLSGDLQDHLANKLLNMNEEGRKQEPTVIKPPISETFTPDERQQSCWLRLRKSRAYFSFFPDLSAILRQATLGFQAPFPLYLPHWYQIQASWGMASCNIRCIPDCKLLNGSVIEMIMNTLGFKPHISRTIVTAHMTKHPRASKPGKNCG